MELNYSTIALLFPAVPLIVLVYANTSVAIGARLREVFERVQDTNLSGVEYEILRDEAAYLAKRFSLLRFSQVLNFLTFLFNMLTLVSIYVGKQVLAESLFAYTVVVMMFSILLYLLKISISVNPVRVLWRQIQRKQSILMDNFGIF